MFFKFLDGVLRTQNCIGNHKGNESWPQTLIF